MELYLNTDSVLASDDVVNVTAVSPLSTRIGQAVALAMNFAPDYQFILERKANRVSVLSWFFGSFATKLALRYGSILSTESGDAGIFTFAPGQSPSFRSLISAGVFGFPKHFGWIGSWRALMLGNHLEKRRLSLVPQDHWYVLAVGVAPDSQGQGKGHSLIARVLQQADADGLPCYLEVFEEDLILLYERLGFNVVNKDSLSSGLTLWSLLRPASAL